MAVLGRWQPLQPFALLLLCLHNTQASLPQVDFDRMGKVGLTGSFAGLDFFSNTSALDPSASTLLSRSSSGALSRLASTNSGGSIVAGCALDDLVYFAGSFSSINGTSANNIVSYDPSSDTFSSLGSNGPNGPISALYCDSKEGKMWAGGKFTSPGSTVATWNPKSSSWSSPPFGGFSGAEAEVLSITTNASESSIFFAGSFIASFQGNGTTVINSTNNPNVPFSAGATPFSSSLVPIPLQNAQIDAEPSTSESGFSNISNILCPAGADGAGNTWFAANGNTAVINIRTFSYISASGIRLGNTFLGDHATTGFTVTTIPDNVVQTLTYLDPSDNTNKTCSNPCPLQTNSSNLYQDFLFSSAVAATGIQIQLTEWVGAAPGLHLLQILSSGAFASAVDSQNLGSCFSESASNASFTGSWQVEQANTNIAGTIQSVLVSDVNVGTSAASGPSVTWNPYVSASGNYDVNLLVPGCTDLQDCGKRTSVKVTVFPGGGLQPTVNTVSQQNQNDETILVYSGPIVPSGSSFTTTVTMTLADDPTGNGQDGQYELVAGMVQLVLTSANITADTSSSSGNGTIVSGSSAKSAFGFFEWPLSSSSSVNAASFMPNSTETALDSIGFGLFTALGGNSSLTSSNPVGIAAVAHHPSGTVFLGGNFTLSSGIASGSSNIVAFSNGALSALSNNGLNGPVTSIVVAGNFVYVGGSFTDTESASTSGALSGIAAYDVSNNKWSALSSGVDGAVTSLSFNNDAVQVVGNFTQLQGGDISAHGFATWNVTSGSWVDNGGFLVGSMTFVGNGTSPGKGQEQTQYLAGSVQSTLQFGSSGMVMLSNGASNQPPTVTPLGVQLENNVTVGTLSTSASSTKRSYADHHATSSWLPHFRNMFKRQSSSSSSLTPLPSSPPAIAPAVLAGTFWTNTSNSHQVAILAGNFSFSSGSTNAQAVAIYDPTTSTLSALQGPQINGTVWSLLVVQNTLYVGGEFSLSGTNVNGLAVYDLSNGTWQTDNMAALQASSGNVVVRSITTSSSKANTIIVAGSFSQAGSLNCQAICSWDTSKLQWNALGNGVKGDVSSVSYAGDNQAILIASGSLALSSGASATNVLQFPFANATWASVGSNLPGPVTALTVNNGNASSIFAAGRSTDGSSVFLAFWNGQSWNELDSPLGGTTNISQLAMVPLQDTHSANSIIESDRMLMISGYLTDSSFGNASTALFDGENYIPYIVSSSASGSPGFVSSLFNSISNFSFAQHHYLAVGIVILISIAIAAGVVFLIALIGILWTLFSRNKDDRANKYDPDMAEFDDDSTHHRPSSLLEHINAATRTTIFGNSNSPYSFNHPYATGGKEEAEAAAAAGGVAGAGAATAAADNSDPFAPDAGGFARAETPSEAIVGGMGDDEDTGRLVRARYSFDGAGEGELPLAAGAEVEILDDQDQAWWYVRDVRTGQEGVIPAAYVY